MTTIDVLFWLLVVLLGGITWAIEAGLVQRHRTVIMSSAVATLGTMVFLMFWVDDATKIIPLEEQTYKRKITSQDARGLKEDIEVNVKDSKGKGGKAGAPIRVTREGKGKGGGKGLDGLKDLVQMEDAQPEPDEKVPTIYNRTPFTDCPVCPSMVIVPEGVSRIGSSRDEQGRTSDETPAEATPVPRPFAVGRLEILRVEYAAFVKETEYQSIATCDVGKRRGKFAWNAPGFEQDERHPVACLSIHDVQAYLGWLKEKSGRAYRLPSEVEWEHAARAGTETPYWMGNSVSRRTANVGRSRDGTTVSGMFAANDWGLSDQVGNLWEMTAQCMLKGNEITHENGAEGNCRRLLKGGAWSSIAGAGRHGARRALADGAAINDVGFRVVRDVDERDDDKVLSADEVRALQKAEEDAAELKLKDLEAAEESALKAREAAEAADAADRAKAQKAAPDKAGKK